MGLALMAATGLWLLPVRAPATIAEQRARLPPAAECGDEVVEGVWRAHQYWAFQRSWYVFTLYIRRVPGSAGELTGRITSQSWMGTRSDEEPPSCAQQPSQRTVSFEARGRVADGGQIQFGGVGQWRVAANPCNSRMGGYNLDNFSGLIEPERLEFQSVNNDGGEAVNIPTVFRRVRCPPEVSADAPSVNPIPPAFYPDSRAGCGR